MVVANDRMALSPPDRSRVGIRSSSRERQGTHGAGSGRPIHHRYEWSVSAGSLWSLRSAVPMRGASWAAASSSGSRTAGMGVMITLRRMHHLGYQPMAGIAPSTLCAAMQVLAADWAGGLPRGIRNSPRRRRRRLDSGSREKFQPLRKRLPLRRRQRSKETKIFDASPDSETS